MTVAWSTVEPSPSMCSTGIPSSLKLLPMSLLRWQFSGRSSAHSRQTRRPSRYAFTNRWNPAWYAGVRANAA